MALSTRTSSRAAGVSSSPAARKSNRFQMHARESADVSLTPETFVSVQANGVISTPGPLDTAQTARTRDVAAAPLRVGRAATTRPSTLRPPTSTGSPTTSTDRSAIRPDAGADELSNALVAHRPLVEADIGTAIAR